MITLIVTLESFREAKKGERYPRCLGGERKGPPEDVGGPFGYENFLEAMADPEHEEHANFKQWVGGAWDPERFQPADVLFSQASKRLKRAGLG